jgi:excinuclease ABC subunit A
MSEISPATHLIIRGARQHNLKNVNLDIPKNQLIVFTGLSGSGKSSMAFDTIYAEGQRRYVESLSSYARQFLGIMDKPDLDRIDGLAPAISIDQKSGSHNPRSTVGTVTEIYDYMRLLFARVGHPHCPNCGREIEHQDPEKITRQILDMAQLEPSMYQNGGVRLMVLSPVVRHQKGQFKDLILNLKKKGFHSARIDGRVVNLGSVSDLIKTNFHNIDVVIDRIVVEQKSLSEKLPELAQSTKNRIFESVESAIALSSGTVIVAFVNDKSLSFPEEPKDTHDHLFSEKFACPVCNISLPEIEPRTFSFNSPEGACTVCSGLGNKLTINKDLVIAPRLTLNQGAIIPIAGQFETDTWLARLIRAVAHANGFDEKTRLSEIKDEQMDVLLNGTKDQIWAVEGFNSQGKPTVWHTKYLGIIAEMEKRYQETTSDYVRQELEKFMVKTPCPSCHGKRLKPESLSVTIKDISIADLTAKSIKKAADFVLEIKPTLTENENKIADPILQEITDRLAFLNSVGLDYLTIDREAGTLAGGELQRIRLASQIGSRLTGILYVLDEPTIGLHERDNKRLINTLRDLQKLGNSLIVVEHDREMMLAADQLVEFGPGAGHLGGTIVYQGSVEDVGSDSKSLTGQYLSGKKEIKVKRQHQFKIETEQIVLHKAAENNLKNVDLKIPLGKLIGITGVSGSGKSTLIVGTLYEALAKELLKNHQPQLIKYEKIDIPKQVRRVSLIDQSPIGRTPRSNPATYTKSFDYIRKIFATTQEAKLRGYDQGRFSFNVKGGRCEACQGDGQNKIEMQFMADIYVTCPVCQGKRYNSPTLEIEYHGKNIAEVLDMTVEEGVTFFKSVTGLSKRLATLQQVGLGYIKLGQPAPTLSGGEAQRIKLASELAKTGAGHTVYILDEPTTGLHFEDLQKLLEVLVKLVENGNTVVVIEHNLDLIRNMDYLIDMGPEGGEGGGQIIAEGTPKDIAAVEKSYTGQELKLYLR